MKLIATSPKAQFLCTQGFLEFTQGHLDPMEVLAMVAANQIVILRQEKNMMIYAACGEEHFIHILVGG